MNPIILPPVLVLCEMQSVSSRIWTRVAVSISYDDNHYTMSSSCITCIFHKGWYTVKPSQQQIMFVSLS